MRRPNRDIQTFNLSMLDVICSGLGAFLILFILSSQDATKARAEAEQAAKREQQARAEAQQARAEAEKARKELEAERQKQRVAAIPKGASIGDCRVTVEEVSIRIRDHGEEDGDRVRVELNGAVQDPNYELKNQPRVFRVRLPPGPSVFVVTAHNTGSKGDNTAEVVVDPCKDGRPDTFTWNMKTGEKKHVSIERQ